MPRNKPNKKPSKTPFKATQLAGFRKQLLKRRETIKGNVKTLGEKTIGKNTAEESGDISRLPIHMADVGSDVFEQDLNLNLVESEVKELELIEEAIERLDKKEFGLCENCENPIPAKRLKVIPYTKLCVECKQREEGS